MEQINQITLKVDVDFALSWQFFLILFDRNNHLQ